MIKLLLGKPARAIRVARVTPPSALHSRYMNVLIASSTRAPASPISTSFHVGRHAKFHQPPEILTQAEATGIQA